MASPVEVPMVSPAGVPMGRSELVVGLSSEPPSSLLLNSRLYGYQGRSSTASAGAPGE